MMGLNARQQRFTEEYLIDLNATQAAIRAGYSAKTAYSHGQRLLKNVEVQQTITSLKESRSDRTKIDADWLLNRLAQEAVADVADIYNESGSLKPVHEWPKIWRQGLVAGLDVHQEFTYEDGKQVPDGVTMKVKLSDRVKRLELIGRHVDVQAFKDKIDVNAQVAHIMPVPSCTSVDEWEKQAQEQQGDK